MYDCQHSPSQGMFDSRKGVSMKHSSENNFKDFFKNNADFLFILDMKGNIIETNNAVHAVLGYSNEDLIGKSILTVHPPEFEKEAGEILKQLLSGENAFCTIPLLTKNNEQVPVETRIFPGFWDSKKALICVNRDLTEKKLSEEKFSSVFEHSNVLMAISMIDTGAFVNVNQKFIDTLEYTREELIGKSSKELNIFPDYMQRQKAMQTTAKEGRVKDYETVIKTKSGKLLNCLFSLSKLKIQTYEYLLTTATDVTPLKKAESKIQYLFKQEKLLADISQLLNSTANLESLLDNVLKLIGEHADVSMVYIFKDTENGTIAQNTYKWSNIGVDPQKEFRQLIRYNMIPSFKNILLKEGSIFSNNIDDLPEDLSKALKPQGIESILIYPLYVQGAFYGFIGFHESASNKEWREDEIELLCTVSNIISNALERKQVLNKLENSELRLKLAIDSANECLWDWNLETGYLYFSEVWYEMLGFKPEEMAPHISSWKARIHPDDLPATIELLRKLLKGESEFYEAVFRVKTKDGDWKWVLVHGMVVERNPGKKPMRAIGTIIEVTKQKEIEEQLMESIETKNMLFSIIAHDLRGPIGNIISILDLITNDKGLDEAEKNEFLDNLKKTSESTFRLLENLLTWSRSQSNTILLSPTQFNINKVINGTVELLSTAAEQKEIILTTKIEGNYSVFADVDSAGMIVRNLISNAIKFTPKGGSVTISTSDNGRQIEVEVADTGVGMKKEIVDALFTSKPVSSTFGTNREKGSGLGLILCKDFVKRNGGRIRVESVLGKGTKFVFTLPKSPAVHM
jgi:PAS domain S-box-containing protein